MANQKKMSAKTVATGAAGVAVAAAAVAGVAAMADKETRNSVVKSAQDLYKTATSKEAKEMTGAMQQQFKSTAHQISLSKKRSEAGKKGAQQKHLNEKQNQDQGQNS